MNNHLILNPKKAVAHHTTASFIRVVGSEFVQKYLGEGPRMVRDVFRLAKENSPRQDLQNLRLIISLKKFKFWSWKSIIFIDEVDAIATKRFDAQTGADREVQRILLEILTQMDGFDQSVNVKVIMATNRQDTLDPALLRAVLYQIAPKGPILLQIVKTLKDLAVLIERLSFLCPIAVKSASFFQQSLQKWTCRTKSTSKISSLDRIKFQELKFAPSVRRPVWLPFAKIATSLCQKVV